MFEKFCKFSLLLLLILKHNNNYYNLFVMRERMPSQLYLLCSCNIKKFDSISICILTSKGFPLKVNDQTQHLFKLN